MELMLADDCYAHRHPLVVDAILALVQHASAARVTSRWTPQQQQQEILGPLRHSRACMLPALVALLSSVVGSFQAICSIAVVSCGLLQAQGL